MSRVAAQLHEHGFDLITDVVDPVAVTRYRAALDTLDPGAGVRALLHAVPQTRALIDAARLGFHLAGVMGPDARIVRAILFDKSRGANWRVPWHQDLFVATSGVAEVAGFSAWTRKDGVAHARAPREVLEHMVAVRIHIDDCGAENGPLRVLPGTHRSGVLDGDAIDRWAASTTAVACAATAGSALVMRPLLLHASSSATSPMRRRVVHLEIADAALPPPLEWHESQRIG